MKKSIILVLLAGLLLSCASVEVFKDEALTQKAALRVYTAKPYLLVARTSAEDRPIEVSVIYLPDLARPLFIKPVRGLGSSDLKVTLANGMLTSYGVSTEAQLGDTLKGLASLLSGGAEAFAALVKGLRTAPPGEEVIELYEVRWEDGKTVLERVEIK
jgi:hypothetical protein